MEGSVRGLHGGTALRQVSGMDLSRRDRREIVGSTLPFVINVTRVVEASSDDKDEVQIDPSIPSEEALVAP
ncbi:hypothetical protein BV22DRAFT_1031519 [Leucogyrophana mollusca]|uniref:Uncharacterized protein n=1 Tax=Leucogyrophana mollusca TaxID=85980 RepID=A0ACB8BSP2_9AGAM|nr:hypothetical protein BV22DRAFT_1031519 [Leucogyrophana mollusca]